MCEGFFSTPATHIHFCKRGLQSKFTFNYMLEKSKVNYLIPKKTVHLDSI